MSLTTSPNLQILGWGRGFKIGYFNQCNIDIVSEVLRIVKLIFGNDLSLNIHIYLKILKVCNFPFCFLLKRLIQNWILKLKLSNVEMFTSKIWNEREN